MTNEDHSISQGDTPVEVKTESRLVRAFRGPARLAIFAVFFLVFAAGFMSFVGKRFVAEVTQDAVLPSATSTYVALNLPAQQFFLPDGDGEITTLAQLRGTPVILLFWASWNSASLDQIQVFSRMKLPVDVVLLAINTQENPNKAKNAIERGKYNVKVLYDEDGSIGELYGAKNLPVLYFIDRDGVIRSISSGVVSEKSIAARVESILR